MTETDHEGILSRWSRRKAEARERAAVDSNAPEAGDGEQEDPAAADEKVEAVEQPVLTDDDMPPLESLGEDSDYSMFMSSGVSEKLRKLALRKMFHTSAFNIRDGLDEYDEDYTAFEPLGDIVTSDMKHQLEMLEKKKQEAVEALALEEDEEVVEDMDEEVEPQELLEDDETSGEEREIASSETADNEEINETRVS